MRAPWDSPQGSPRSMPPASALVPLFRGTGSHIEQRSPQVKRSWIPVPEEEPSEDPEKARRVGAVALLDHLQAQDGTRHENRATEIKKLDASNTWTNVHRDDVMPGARPRRHTWVDKPEKSRSTCADVKRAGESADCETFSPTPHPASHRLLETKALRQRWNTRSADLVSAFLIARDQGDSNGQRGYMYPPKEYKPMF